MIWGVLLGFTEETSKVSVHWTVHLFFFIREASREPIAVWLIAEESVPTQSLHLYAVATVNQRWGGGMLSSNNLLLPYSEQLLALSAKAETLAVFMRLTGRVWALRRWPAQRSPVKVHLIFLILLCEGGMCFGDMLSVDVPSVCSPWMIICLHLKSEETPCSMESKRGGGTINITVGKSQQTHFDPMLLGDAKSRWD